MLLTALAGLVMGLLTSVYTRARGMFTPEAVTYSADGQAMAARYTDGTVQLWNQQGQQLSSFDTREGWVNWSMDDEIQLIGKEKLVAQSDAGRFEVWDVAAGEKESTIGNNVFSVRPDTTSVSADGSTAAAIQAGAQVDVDIFDTATGQRIKRMPPEIGGAQGIALSGDGQKMAVMRYGGQVEVWDIEAEEQLFGPHELDADPLNSSVAFDPQLRVAAAVQPDRYSSVDGQPIELLDIETGQSAEIHTPEPVTGLKLSPDGRVLATWGPQSEVTFIDTTNGEQRGQIQPWYETPVFDFSEFLLPTAPPIAFSPDGSEVIVGSNSEVAIYDVASGKLKKRLWGSSHALGAWFFGPAMFGWAILWGIARRRQRLAEASNVENFVSAEVVEQEESPADEGASARGDSDEIIPARLSTKPPQSLIVAWILLFLGGTLSITLAMSVIFSEWTCFALTPFPYFSLYVGLMTIAAAAGRRTDKLPLVYSLQMASIICCDLINFTLGTIGLILVHRPAAQDFSAQAAAPR